MIKTKTVIFNLNSNIKVRLNEIGQAMLDSYYDSIREKMPPRLKDKIKTPTQDINGYTELQMNDVICIFGAYMEQTINPPFSMDVLIDVDEIKEHGL